MAERVRVEEIYDAAFDDEGFSRIAASLASWFGARSALIHWIHEDGATDILSHSGYFTDAQLADYAQNFVAKDPWVEAAAHAGQVNSVLKLEELVPVAQFTASEFYNDYVRAMGDDTCRCLGIRLENQCGSGYVALQRGIRQRGFEQSTATRLEEYLPHLRRMLSIRGRLASAQHLTSEVSAALDTIGLPVFLVDRELRIRQLNSAAEELLRQRTGLRSRHGRLEALAAPADAALGAAVERAVSNAGGEATAVAAPVSGGSSLYLTVAPAGAGGRRGAVVIANSPAGPCDSRVDRLRGLFGLSPVEATLAVMLADGRSPAEIAECRGVSLATVRVQIKQIATKLGCRRQSDIVRTVAALPPVFNASGADRIFEQHEVGRPR